MSDQPTKTCPRCRLPMVPRIFFPGYWECASASIWLEVNPEDEGYEYDEDDPASGRVIYDGKFALFLEGLPCAEIDRLREELVDKKRTLQSQFDKGRDHQRWIYRGEL